VLFSRGRQFRTLFGMVRSQDISWDIPCLYLSSTLLRPFYSGSVRQCFTISVCLPLVQPLIDVFDVDFWGLIIGIRLFGFYVYKLYPVAFVMTILGIPEFADKSDVRSGDILHHRKEHCRGSNETMVGRRKPTKGNRRSRHL